MKAQNVRQASVQSTLSTAASPRRQRGAVIVLTAIAMLVLLGIAALSLDGGHMILNNDRLQNIVDASALEAAAVLSNGGNSTDAAVAAEELLVINAGTAGYKEIAAEIGDVPLDPTLVRIDFSNTLVPFIGVGRDTEPYTFVRVTVNGLSLQPWFMQIFGLSKGVSVSAVSAAIQTNGCDIIPLVLCGSEDGYEDGELVTMKLAAGNEFDFTKGSFRVLKLPSGPPDVMINMAGGVDACPGEFKSQPGNHVGPTVKGLNTRFEGATHPKLVFDPAQYEEDLVTGYPEVPGTGFPGDPSIELDDDGAMTWYEPLPGADMRVDLKNDTCSNNIDPVTGLPTGSELSDEAFDPYCFQGPNSLYTNEYIAHTTGVKSPNWLEAEFDGQRERRLIGVPITNCDDPSDPIVIDTLGCFFLLQPVIQVGNLANVFGEYVEECSIPFPVVPVGASKIILYKDPDKVDS